MLHNNALHILLQYGLGGHSLVTLATSTTTKHGLLYTSQWKCNAYALPMRNMEFKCTLEDMGVVIGCIAGRAYSHGSLGPAWLIYSVSQQEYLLDSAAASVDRPMGGTEGVF